MDDVTDGLVVNVDLGEISYQSVQDFNHQPKNQSYWEKLGLNYYYIIIISIMVCTTSCLLMSVEWLMK